MADYINREYLIKTLTNNADYRAECGYERAINLDSLIKYIKGLPTEDVVPVVRCKNCIYANDYGTICRYGVGRQVEPEHYCSYGERK